MPSSPRMMSTATAGSVSSGNDDDRMLPWNAAVGANRPVTASWFFRRSAESVIPGGSNFVAPCDSIVVRSVGRHCTVCVRVSPSGQVTVNVGAYPWPSRYTRSPAVRSGSLTSR